MLRVRVKPKYKKCVSEIETYFNEKRTVEAVKETLWRWGEFEVDMTKEEYDELTALSANAGDDWYNMTTEISEYENFEMCEVWDGISVDVEFYTKCWEDSTEEAETYEKELKKEEEGNDWDYDYELWLEANGFGYEPDFWEILICGPLELEIVNEEV